MVNQVLICDKCKREKPEIRRIYVYRGRKSDAAGQMEDDDYPKDLCPDCMHTIINRMQYGNKLIDLLPEY